MALIVGSHRDMQVTWQFQNNTAPSCDAFKNILGKFSWKTDTRSAGQQIPDFYILFNVTKLMEYSSRGGWDGWGM
jgi:hypothetical protein